MALVPNLTLLQVELQRIANALETDSPLENQTVITSDFKLPAISTLEADKIYRLINRSGQTWEISTTTGDFIEGELTQEIFDGETFDLTIDGNNFRIWVF